MPRHTGVDDRDSLTRPTGELPQTGQIKIGEWRRRRWRRLRRNDAGLMLFGQLRGCRRSRGREPVLVDGWRWRP